MNISITSEAQGGHLIIYLFNSNGAKILTLRDNDAKSCMLVPDKKYRFEWHVWGSENGSYKITANVQPENPGFPDFSWERTYDGSHEDMGGFYFTT